MSLTLQVAGGQVLMLPGLAGSGAVGCAVDGATRARAASWRNSTCKVRDISRPDAPPAPSGSDEADDVETYGHATMERMEAIVWSVKATALNLGGSGKDLAANMSDTAAAINEITAMIDSVNKRIADQGNVTDPAD